MKDVSTFLFGKKVANQMQALHASLRSIETKHHDYFAATRSKYVAQDEHKPATLDEFVQPWWINHQLTLTIEPTLRQDIAEECLACAQLVAALPPPVTFSQEFAAGFQVYVRRRFYRFARLRIRFTNLYGSTLAIRPKPRSSSSTAL
ncbi:MAG: hypothetical protein EOO60_02770 [Hymenobacter sp.]|nr:MAG: hypothetical protein EOO60_02770 [Hymenobacter sp.]